jgi:hypothetical protein
VLDSVYRLFVIQNNIRGYIRIIFKKNYFAPFLPWNYSVPKRTRRHSPPPPPKKICLRERVIHSYRTTKKLHLLSRIIYSCKTLYMFRTVFPSIIRSSKLRIRQQVYVKQLLLVAGSSSSCLTCTVTVYVVLSSWWLTERPSETCRAIYKNK